MAQKTLRSPTAGVISVVHKSAGETIEEDEEILVIECMKMEIPVPAAAAGTIAQLNVKVGDSVVEDQPLVVIQTR
jgi:acetyl-CoA carboxylase biotin carboxyl carrier protein